MSWQCWGARVSRAIIDDNYLVTLGPDRNSGGICSGPVPVDPFSSQTVLRATLQFQDCITCSPPSPSLYHVLPSSSKSVSRAPLKFPVCITCSPQVPRLYHVLPSSSQSVSRAPLKFPDCITCSPQVPSLYHVLPSGSQTVSRARNVISFDLTRTVTIEDDTYNANYSFKKKFLTS